MLSATVFLLLGSARKPINLSEKFPQFREFHRQIWAGDSPLVVERSGASYGKTGVNRIVSGSPTIPDLMMN
jgi:hypothetical protein